MYEVASPWNIFFAWGDWSVAAIVRADRMDVFVDVCRSEGIEWRRLGHAKADPGITAELNGNDQVFNVHVIRNESFVSHGFNAGLSGHLDFILRTPLLTRRDRFT
jgi:thiamine-monophosphate kinase